MKTTTMDRILSEADVGKILSGIREKAALIENSVKICTLTPVFASLVSWVLLNTTQSCTRHPDRRQTASRPTPKNFPFNGCF
jgi:hypothetical protein